MADTSWTSEPKVQQAMAYFQGQGWKPGQAAGIVSNLYAESPGLDQTRFGDNNNAYGIGQWHPDRQQQFEDWSGKPIQGSSFEDQLAFVQHELTQGEDAGARKAGKLLAGAQTAPESATIMMQGFERPADHSGIGYNALHRGLKALELHDAATANAAT